MNAKVRKLTVLALAFVMAAGSVFAQGLGVKKSVNLTIVVNVPGASIYLDNQLIAGNVVTVPAAKHNIRVHADGYVDSVQVVDVANNMTLNVQLRPQMFPLTVRVSVANAAIFIDGQQVAGNVLSVQAGNHSLQVTAPGFQDYNASLSVTRPTVIDVPLQLQAFPLTISVNVAGASVVLDGQVVTGTVPAVAMGSHQLQVTAPGYKDYSAVVNVAGATAVNVALQAAGFPLTVNSNVRGASVFVNNVLKGASPYSEVLAPDTYSVRVSAPGYADYLASVSLDRAVAVNVVLQPAAPTLMLTISSAFLDQDIKPNDPAGQVKIFVDNVLVNPRREMGPFSVAPGKHRIRISSGGLSVQLGEVDMQPGMGYTIDLSMGLVVRPARQSQ